MSLTREQRKKLVELLMSVPPASSFAGRTALLGDSGRLALNREQGNTRLDLEGIVQQLDLLQGDALAMLIENAVDYVPETALARELEALLQIAKGPSVSLFTGGAAPTAVVIEQAGAAPEQLQSQGEPHQAASTKVGEMALKAMRSKLMPSYANDATRALSEELQSAYARRLEKQKANEPTIDTERIILDLRRRIREGGQLRAGDFLGAGRYLLLERIGHGGFAFVWRSLDRERGMIVAVKVLHASLASDPAHLQRFFRGARVMSEFNHEGIVSVLNAAEEDEGYQYFVMEYVEGKNFRQATIERRFSEQSLISLILQVGTALTVAHERGMVHRDVKPTNILLDNNGSPKLTDFDLVWASDTTGGTKTGGLGTFVYAAPECLHHPQDADARADVYGLGMTAIFGLYGKELPSTVLRDANLIVDALACSSAVKAVLRRAIAWDRDKRFSDVTDFCRALKNAQAKWSLFDLLGTLTRVSLVRMVRYVAVAGLLVVLTGVIVVVTKAWHATDTKPELENVTPVIPPIPTPSGTTNTTPSSHAPEEHPIGDITPVPSYGVAHLPLPAVSANRGSSVVRPSSSAVELPPVASSAPREIPSAETVDGGAKRRPHYILVESPADAWVYLDEVQRGRPGQRIEYSCNSDTHVLRVRLGKPDPSNPTKTEWSNRGAGTSIVLDCKKGDVHKLVL